jgi:hypothetical protein
MRIVLALGCMAALGGFPGAVILLPERADEPAPSVHADASTHRDAGRIPAHDSEALRRAFAVW